MYSDEELTREIIGAAIRVHRELGPGLIESACETRLVLELSRCGIPFQRQVPLPIVCDNEQIDAGYRLDLVVNRRVRTVEQRPNS